MKTFKDLIENVGSPAADNKKKKDVDAEVKDIMPRSKGEEDFKKQHTVAKTDHPVAEPHQHTGDRKGPKSDAGEDLEGNEKPGQKIDSAKSFAQFAKMGGHGQSSKRRPDKTAGDKTAVMQGSSKVKEDTDLEEDTKAQQKGYKVDAIKHAGRIVASLKAMEPDYNCRYTARQLQDIADQLENSVENQKKFPSVGMSEGKGVGFKEHAQLIDETFKAGSIKLNSGETVKVDEASAKLLNNAFKQLNKSNQKRMQKEALKDKKAFSAMIAFAKNV